MANCPHKKIVARGNGWYCDWCEQPFMPQTVTAVMEFIQADEEINARVAAVNAGMDPRAGLTVKP